MPNPSALPLMSWGRLRLFGASIDTDASRTIVVHDMSSGNVHPTTDRGERARRVRVALQFDDFPGQPGPYDALKLLLQAKRDGAVAIFSHPIEGNFPARIGEFNYQLDEHSVPHATAEFIGEDELVGLSQAGPGTSPSAGQGAVSAAADTLDNELATVKARPLSHDEVLQFISDPSSVRRPPLTDEEVAELISDPSDAFVTDDARASSSNWIDGDDVSARTILIDVARVTDKTAILIEEQRLESDLALFPAFRAAIMFGDAFRQAAVAASSQTPAVFMMRVVARTSLLALAGRVYGGAEADQRAAQIMSLNDIATPGWLAPGDYMMPTPSRSRRGQF